MRYRDTTFDFEPCQEKGVELCEVERNLIRIQAFNASHSTAVPETIAICAGHECHECKHYALYDKLRGFFFLLDNLMSCVVRLKWLTVVWYFTWRSFFSLTWETDFEKSHQWFSRDLIASDISGCALVKTFPLLMPVPTWCLNCRVVTDTWSWRTFQG